MKDLIITLSKMQSWHKGKNGLQVANTILHVGMRDQGTHTCRQQACTGLLGSFHWLEVSSALLWSLEILALAPAASSQS